MRSEQSEFNDHLEIAHHLYKKLQTLSKSPHRCSIIGLFESLESILKKETMQKS